jgi:hypothetical protein
MKKKTLIMAVVIYLSMPLYSEMVFTFSNSFLNNYYNSILNKIKAEEILSGKSVNLLFGRDLNETQLVIRTVNTERLNLTTYDIGSMRLTVASVKRKLYPYSVEIKKDDVLIGMEISKVKKKYGDFNDGSRQDDKTIVWYYSIDKEQKTSISLYVENDIIEKVIIYFDTML